MFMIHKTKLNNTLRYIEFVDWDEKHHIIERNCESWIFQDEWDWTYDINELMTHIAVAMDDRTELLIAKASEVEWSPYNNGYFYY